MSTDQPAPTEDRLLRAAVGLFAARGFAATSVRQVCQRADANVAAVNYHFRSKGGLYDAAIDHARAASVARNPWVELDTERNFWADRAPEERLRLFVAMTLDHSLDADGAPSELARIMIHEMLDPTEAFERQVDVSIRRVFEALADICRQIHAGVADAPRADGPAGRPDDGPADALIESVAFLISAQCMYPALVAGVTNGLHPGVAFDTAGRAALAEHITSGALALLRTSPAPHDDRQTQPTA